MTATQPLVSADDLATLDQMAPYELASELNIHDQVSRHTASDDAYRAEIVARLNATPSLLGPILDQTRSSSFLATLAALPGSMSAA